MTSKFSYGGQACAQTRVITPFTVRERDIEIDPHQRNFAVKSIKVVQSLQSQRDFLPPANTSSHDT